MQGAITATPRVGGEMPTEGCRDANVLNGKILYASEAINRGHGHGTGIRWANRGRYGHPSYFLVKQVVEPVEFHFIIPARCLAVPSIAHSMSLTLYIPLSNEALVRAFTVRSGARALDLPPTYASSV
ncbi:MAG: hypothetical protein GY820_47185 [Gammaproteobacteria bacterium]|nr:hypothetical protein [Gammaproteobacteria bacterium]